MFPRYFSYFYSESKIFTKPELNTRTFVSQEAAVLVFQPHVYRMLGGFCVTLLKETSTLETY